MLVTLHLFGVPAARIPAALLRMAVDRRHLAGTSGLSFWKLLGTGDGRTFTLGDADPRRWGLLAVWETPADLARFERTSRTAATWRRLADERWRVDMVCVRSRGTWSGREPFGTGAWDAGAGAPADGPQPASPVAAITRARLRPSRMRSFWAAVPPVALDAATAPGLRLATGIGEAPIGVQGTFSLWESESALAGFAYRGAAHRAVIARTAPARWYSEELFARFAVCQTTGTVGGVDPLAR